MPISTRTTRIVSDRNKVNIALIVVISGLVGVIIHGYHQYDTIDMIGISNVKGKEKYFELYLKEELEEELDSFIHLPGTTELSKLAVQQQQVVDRGKDHSTMQFFADDPEGRIRLNSNPEALNKTNLEHFGKSGDRAFRKIRRATMDAPNLFVPGSYFGDEGSGDERIGVYKFDTKTSLIYGVVLRDAFFAKERQTRLYKMVWIIGGYLTWILVAMFYFLFRLVHYKRSAEEFYTALERTRTGVALLELDSTITWTNTVLEDWFGEGYNGRNLLDFSNYSDFHSVFERCLRLGEAHYQVAENLNDSRRTFAVRLSKYPYNSWGKEKIILTISDVSEVIHGYEVFSHDLAKHLNMTFSSAFKLRSDLEGKSSVSIPEAKKALLSILSGIEGARLYADSLFIWARFQTDNVGLDNAAIKLRPFVSGLFEKFTSTFELFGIEAHFQIDKKAIVFTDRRNLEAVIRNLISNAIRAVQCSDIRKIKLVFIETPTEFIFQVMDTGEGMSSRKKATVFDLDTPFSGLGSYVVAKYAATNEGSVNVDYSDPEYGTSITLRIPIYNLT